MAPTHRVSSSALQGQLAECGGIWKKQNKVVGAGYDTLTIREHGCCANLRKAANEDDLSYLAVIL